MTEQIKYNCSFSSDAVLANINRLTNQLWKLIPMRENDENWRLHLQTLIVELSGLCSLYCKKASYINLLSKLEGILIVDTEFSIYRKIVFESISLLREMVK